MTYYICRDTNCYQLGRLLPDDTVEGFNVKEYLPDTEYRDVWDWGHFEHIDKTHEFESDSPYYEVCEAAWAAFVLGSREAAYELLKEIVP